MQKPKLIVKTQHSSYPVFLGEKLLRNRDFWHELISNKHVFVISDENVAPYYLESLQASLNERIMASFILKAGEAEKTLRNFSKIIDALAEQAFTRDCLILGLGGGVVTDIAGFTAACYMRGVSYIAIPTSLLAQVDAAIGGKTGVNHPLAKNLMGCFYQPQAVVIDLETLSTLPDREFRAGLAEVIKMAVSLDANFFNYLEDNIHKILAKDKSCLLYTIQHCCALKVSVVQQDEKEHGIRTLLNFGHTYGHALEKLGNYQTYLHGEAVAIGMAIAAEISTHKAGLKVTDKNRLLDLIATTGLPTQMPSNIDQDELQKILQLDKKNKIGELRMVLLEKVGQAKIC